MIAEDTHSAARCVGFVHAPDKMARRHLANWAWCWREDRHGRRVKVETRRGRAGIALYEAAV